MKIQKAAVVGAGAMGSGIAQVLSQAGIEVLLKDVKKEYVDRGLANIKRMYDSRVKREVLTQEEADRLFSSVKGTIDYQDFKEVDLVIEAALEEIEVKLQIFKELDSICPKHAILASNTSALSISQIASTTKRPELVIGMHFFNPAQAMKLVEVIAGVKTSEKTIEEVLVLCKQLNKIPVKVEECPGFLVNRLLFPYMNEALYVLQEGKTSVEEIDKQMVAFGLPMGPLALFDMTGLDVCAHVNDFLYKQYGPRFKPASILSLLVKNGNLGQKSGAGFYAHNKDRTNNEAKQINPDLPRLLSLAKETSNKEFTPIRVILPMINEAIYALQEKVVQAEDIDVAMKWGCGMNKGPLITAKEKGLAWCLNELNTQGNERFHPAWLLTKLVNAGVNDFSNLAKTPIGVM